MILFDDSKPLVYIHLFKTAGSTLFKIFEKWFQEKNKRFYSHYVNVDDISCTDENISKLKAQGINNPVFFGHFCVKKQSIYPKDCNQYIATIRDPFDVMVSAYYYTKFLNQPLLPQHDNVEKYVLQYDFEYSFTNVFTKENITLDNFKQVLNKYFIAIGSIKNYKKSLHVFENCLNKKIPNELIDLHVNKNTDVDKLKADKQYIVPEYLREIHRELYPLDYAIYDYVNDYYNY